MRTFGCFIPKKALELAVSKTLLVLFLLLSWENNSTFVANQRFPVFYIDLYVFSDKLAFGRGFRVTECYLSYCAASDLNRFTALFSNNAFAAKHAFCTHNSPLLKLFFGIYNAIFWREILRGISGRIFCSGVTSFELFQHNWRGRIYLISYPQGLQTGVCHPQI